MQVTVRAPQGCTIYGCTILDVPVYSSIQEMLRYIVLHLSKSVSGTQYLLVIRNPLSVLPEVFHFLLPHPADFAAARLALDLRIPPDPALRAAVAQP